MVTPKSVFALAVVLLLCGPATADALRVNPARPREDRHGFPRAGRHPQAIQSIEFNGITVLHEDLLHSMSPVQEKLDISRSGISVSVRFQFDDMMMRPMGKSIGKTQNQEQTHGSLSIVHNATDAEIVRVPLGPDSSSQLRGVIQMSQETRRTIKKNCPDTTCVARVSVNNRFYGRPTVIELGKLKVHKKSTGKTTIRLLTYPRLIATTSRDIPWESYGLTWSVIFHFLLVIGSGLMLLVGIEAWRVQGFVPKCEDSLITSKRWLQVALVCSLLFLGMSGSRALNFVSMRDIIVAAPAAAVVAIFAFCFAGGPIDDDDDIDETQDEDYMGGDEEDTQSEGTEETKKTI